MQILEYASLKCPCIYGHSCIIISLQSMDFLITIPNQDLRVFELDFAQEKL